MKLSDLLVKFYFCFLVNEIHLLLMQLMYFLWFLKRFFLFARILISFSLSFLALNGAPRIFLRLA